MSSNSDLDWSRREISTLVDAVNDGERSLVLPVIEGMDDYDRFEAMDIINRIERQILSNMKAPAHDEAVAQ